MLLWQIIVVAAKRVKYWNIERENILFVENLSQSTHDAIKLEIIIQLSIDISHNTKIISIIENESKINTYTSIQFALY